MNLNKTKIIATIGPSSDKKEILTNLITLGVNVCRLNFSHGNHKYYENVIKIIREIDNELGTYTSIIADLQGPKIRVGQIQNNALELNHNNIITFTSKECIGTKSNIYISYTNFAQDVSVGDQILIDDGKITVEVVETNKQNTVKCKVLHGGILLSNKGVNLPNTNISLPCLTKKDLEDLKFILEQDISWIALSFVRSENDIEKLRTIINDNNKNHKIIAKIEKPEAVANIEKIIKKTDAIMVARGDLGVEIPMQDVPLIQKQIINNCLNLAVPVIVATQMMESMIYNITPTRAEINDVANAVIDGADAVMLSGETSIGKFPIDVIKSMYKIIIKTETYNPIYYKDLKPKFHNPNRFISDSICFSAVKIQERTKAKAIITMTHSGYTAFKISSFRPHAYIFVFTKNKTILNTLNLIWGVKSFYYSGFVSTDDTIKDVKNLITEKDYVKKGDLIINTASMPMNEKGTTNMIRLTII